MSKQTVDGGVELGVTEATGVVPGLHLPTPKKRGSKRKQHVTNERFIEVYQTAATAKEACEQLGMPDENGVVQPMTLNNLYFRAKKLADLGIPLKDGFSRKAADISALTELAKKFAKPVEQTEQAAS